MKILNLFALSLCLCILISCSKEKEETHVFILMGQSNMAGYGELLPKDTIPVDRVFMISTMAKEPYKWQPAAHPLHNRLSSDRFGLGLPFAKAYLKKYPDVTIKLIPVAWGGAAIDDLNKGSETYNDAIKKALFAQSEGQIKGVLWHQGESDTVDEELADSYETKLHQLIADLRTDLNNPKLPFIVGNLAEFYGTGKDHNAAERVKKIDQVKKALRDLPSKVKNTGFAESSDCKSIDQHMVHFDRESYILLGKRYVQEIESLLYK
ncbi:sialate O-acetylesterase [Arenibacter sp. 6A1]|uniref:sialate O-acetylesterase n=1 Tax=Arenibacter sp. 6A1 TaxID=2720391 RepID=UPI0014462497|nr:sialate O-acetylesterase [Arenibacter sp. 6A1]NKI27480.1 sialate O-acetylesterase [Arenibacter sp. 6A1]